MLPSNTHAGFLYVLAFSIAIISCEDDLKPPPPPQPPVLTPPVARAGADTQIYLPDERVYLLDGSASYDPDAGGRSLMYTWTKLSGSGVQDLGAHLATSTIMILDSGTYNFELQVRDAQGLVARDTITITAIWGASCKPATGMMFKSNYVLETSLDGAIPIDVSFTQGSGKLVFAGGRTEQDDGWGGYDAYSSKIYVYDLEAKATVKKDLSVARGRIGIAVGRDEIFFAGGILLNQVSDVVDILNTASGSMSKSNLSVARSSVSCGIGGDKVFFAGGRDVHNRMLDVVDIYDLNTKAWSVAKLSIPRAELSIVSSNNKVFFAGGRLNLESVTGRVDVYDLNTGQWSIVDLAEGRSDISSSLVGNTIVFSGGLNEAYLKINKADFLDLNSMVLKSDCLSAQGYNTIYGPNMASTVLDVRDMYYLNSHLITRFEDNSKKWSFSAMPYNVPWVALASSGTKLFAISSEVDEMSNWYLSKISIHRVNF